MPPGNPHARTASTAERYGFGSGTLRLRQWHASASTADRYGFGSGTLNPDPRNPPDHLQHAYSGEPAAFVGGV